MSNYFNGWGRRVLCLSALTYVMFCSSVFASFDYSNVGYEFSRLFARIKVDDLSVSSVFEQKEVLDPFINLFSKNQSQRLPAKFATDLSLQCCRDLRLVCGDEDRERESLLLKLEQPETPFGAIVLASILANPIYDKTLLERRRGFVEFLNKDKDLFGELSDCIKELKPVMQNLVTIMTCDSEKDSTCLLNSFFGVYWGNRSALGFLPKKMSTQIKQLNAKKREDKKKKKDGIGDKVDKRDWLLNLSFGCATFVLAMNWLVQVSSWGKDVGETYNFEFAHRAKQLLRTKSFSEKVLRESEEYFFKNKLRDKLRRETDLLDEEKKCVKAYCKSLEALVDDLKTSKQEKFELSPKGVYRWFLTPRLRQQVEHEVQLIKEGLCLEKAEIKGKKEYNFDPRVLIFDTPKLVNRLMKPAYVVMAPIFILSAIKREARLYKIAVKRARREVEDMTVVLKLCQKIIRAVDRCVSKRPELKYFVNELDLFGGVRDLIGYKHNDDFGSLVKALVEGVGKNPGKLLRVYKQLYQMREKFRFAFEAIGQIDAFLAIAKLADKPGFCFAQYLNSSGEPKIEAKDFWDPQIGHEKAISNSISLGEGRRGMIITGSNAGGKSSFMRAVLCCSVMAQTLTVVPANEFYLSPFEKMFTLMSKKDDPGAGRSLFRVEAESVKEFLEKVELACPGKPLLAALDEMFNSTAPDDAQALTRSVISKVAANPDVISMIATHYSQVTKAQADTGGIFNNYKVTVERDEYGNFVKYKRKIAPGVAGEYDSTAMDVAVMAGIDSKIVENSKMIKNQIKQ